MHRTMTKVLVPAVSVLLASALAACGSTADTGSSGASGGAKADAVSEVHITIGSGLPYAPLSIIRSQGTLEKALPNGKIVWEEGVSGGAATRDGILSGKVQVGVTGIAPFLVGRDKGVKWKVLGSMGQIGIKLVALDPKLKTLKDLKASGRPISVPSPDSGQAIALKTLAKKEFGDAKAFDGQLTPMPHPDAYQALKSGSIGAAFIAPPFQYQLEADGAHDIATAKDAFGPMTYSSVVMSEDFHDGNPAFTAALVKALEGSLKMLADDPTGAAQILSKADGGKVPAATYEGWIKRPDNIWEITPVGFGENADQMKALGLISTVPKTADLFFPDVAGGK